MAETLNTQQGLWGSLFSRQGFAEALNTQQGLWRSNAEYWQDEREGCGIVETLNAEAELKFRL